MRRTRHTYQAAVKYWMSVFRSIEEQTDGLTTHPKEMPDERLISQRPVTDWFLEFAPAMFGVWLPKYHSKLRRVIAYCYELQERQGEAWQRHFVEAGKESLALKMLISQLPAMTKQEQLTATKKHFGWEQ